MNPKLDKSEKIIFKQDNSIYIKEIISLLETMSLSDAWWVIYPSIKRFTWHARGKAARLDYLLISDHLLNDHTNYKIDPRLFSDHSILKFDLLEKI